MRELRARRGLSESCVEPHPTFTPETHLPSGAFPEPLTADGKPDYHRAESRSATHFFEGGARERKIPPEQEIRWQVEACDRATDSLLAGELSVREAAERLARALAERPRYEAPTVEEIRTLLGDLRASREADAAAEDAYGRHSPARPRGRADASRTGARANTRP